MAKILSYLGRPRKSRAACQVSTSRPSYYPAFQVPLDKPVRTGEDYHIRVLVPCYKESLQILQVRCLFTCSPAVQWLSSASYGCSQPYISC